jgi:acyl-CoA reductase-like NAD-dependent aldehyde dehydrogenase
MSDVLAPPQLYRDGQWVPARSGRVAPVLDPATDEAVFELPWGDRTDVEAAIDGAAAAFRAWAARTPYERGAILDRAAALLVERASAYAPRTVLESGKPLLQARGEWDSAPNYLRQAAEEARRLGGRWIPSRLPGRRIDVTPRPLGVVAAITAWNFPVYNVNRVVSSALAAGNAVVVRPSELTPRSALDYAKALHDAGLPPGVLQVVHGDPAPMGQAFLDDPRVRKLAFTGSTRVGRLLMEGAARTVTRLSLELGGNAPVLVCPDVDPVAVARAGLQAKLRNAGQVCIAPQRFYVHRAVLQPFVAAVVEAAGGERLGHGLQAGTTMGPLISQAQRARVHDLVQRSLCAGATLACGGEPLPGPGAFYPPTVLTDVPDDAPILHEEAFGPVLPIVPWDDEDAVLRCANASEHGLAAFVFTRDLDRALRLSDGLEAGLIGLNQWYPVTAEAPFGGVKQSGMGRESGAEGVAEYVDWTTRYWGSG